MTDTIPNSPYVTWDPKDFEKEISLLLSVSSSRSYGEGEMIYLQGETSRSFFFVKKGKVKISILKEDGSEKILAIQEENTFFGESAAFDRHPYFATAAALEESQINVIPVERAEALIMEHPEVAFVVIRRIIRKLRLLGFQVEDSAFLDAQKRIAHIIIKLSTEVGKPCPEGITIQRGITHEDWASMTGLSRVRVTTILNNFERAKIITKRRLALTVIDPEKLRSLLEEPDLLDL
jgi:CRP/FNR family transcriptional regulator, cyclic AMP receptor protein